MNKSSFTDSSPLYIEIGTSILKVLHGDTGLELPLERQPNGQLAASCKEALVDGLKNFLKRKSWQPRLRALCAIGARGVSLRRLALPASAKEEFQKVLLLQIESQFPLPPDELAWGYSRLGGQGPANGEPAKQQLLIAAVRREVIEDYSQVLCASGITPVFTLAALARNGLCPPSQESYAILDVAAGYSELMCFEDGAPSTVRVLPVGQPGTADELDALIEAITGNWTKKKLYVSGNGSKTADLAARLAARLHDGMKCEPLGGVAGAGRSAAILGLKKLVEEESGSPPLVIQLKPANGSTTSARPVPRNWAILAASLLIGLCVWPFAEALLLKPRLAREFSALKADTGRLQTIDRELNFLQFLKQNQPPYLDALFVISKAAPQGARIDSLSMNRRGEISLRGSVRESQMADFRSKLIDSGFFSGVVIEEQTPTPDRQKVMVRVSAQWKPLAARALLAIGPSPEEIQKAATNKQAQAGGPFPSGAIGPIMPPGLILQSSEP